MHNRYILFNEFGMPNFFNQQLKEEQIFVKEEVIVEHIIGGKVFKEKVKQLTPYRYEDVEKIVVADDGEEKTIKVREPLKDENGNPVLLGAQLFELTPLPEGAKIITPEQHNEYITALNSGKKLVLVDGEIKIIEPINEPMNIVTTQNTEVPTSNKNRKNQLKEKFNG